ncbi:MAG TPA: tRNA uridine-5-carboxymethylaminomethyl(34) synthesis GTPase MnmE [Rhizomicrobium sp.]|nr:tRNA uridine-5-carboxymethylaminomethyl(34) synthesis GTPase MnmE [Rhizomicrobium sp.]
MDTIFALSTAPGRAGVAIVRVSGPRAKDALERLTGKRDFSPRQAILARFADADGGEIDSGIVLWFPAPASFTGEDVAEFHVHGGHAIAAAMLRSIGAAKGLRPAEPGEFTRRAVENGKFDLTRAEALADLIDAETEAQRKQAVRQYGGALETLYEGWRARLIRASAWAEAAIDFADEDIPEGMLAESRTTVAEILKEIQAHLNDARRGEILRNGVHITVIGVPNAGKSSLVNALAQRDVAIVSETAGTTRDVIEVHLNLGGYPVILADTAGLRDASETIESEGVRRALARASEGDLTLLLLDGTATDPFAGLPDASVDLTVWNKADLPWPLKRDGIRISARTSEGLPDLIQALTTLVADRFQQNTANPPLTRARHRHALEQVAAALARALTAKESELMAEDLRLALRSLGRITGRVDIEELLDVVFRDFCIGK